MLAGLLLATGLSAAGGQFRINLGPLAVTIESPGKKLAAALAREVAEAEKRFAAKREALPVVRVTGQEPAYPRTEVLGLIEDTRTDLVQAVERVGEPGLGGLSAWAEEEIGRIEQEAVAVPVQAAFEPPGRSTPYAVTRVADLSGRTGPVLAALAAA
ncbi:MAG TPA: hypothetical protein DD490_00170, partial [Acidobacteria bacterium]|nr:hypothetical protein [Acidobacteriota bacterium]